MTDAVWRAESFDHLGKLFNRSRVTPRQWVRHRNWPEGVPKRPPWGPEHQQAIESFVASLGPPQNPTATPKPKTEAEADLAIKQQRARLLKLKADATAKRLVDRGVVERRMLAAIHAVKSGLAALAQSLPAELANTERGQWCQTIQARFDELCERFAQGVDSGG
jgi:hypothetical protein